MNTNEWMKGLDPTQSIAGLSIPGSHESAALRNDWITYWTNSQCQYRSIKDQLGLGIRFLDIRLAEYKDDYLETMKVTHGPIDQHCQINEILNTLIEFLNKNPSEFVLVNVQKYSELGEGTFSERFINRVVGADPKYWYLGAKIPTVLEARGRIVLIRAYDDKSKEGWLSTDGIPWNGFNFDGESENEFFWTQNRWKYITQNAKETWIVQCLDKIPDPKKIILNFLSFSSSGGYSPATGAMDVNPFVLAKIKEPKYESQRLGVIAMDFAGNTPGLIEEIISHNTFP